MEVSDHGDCNCDYCQRVDALVGEIGDIVDGVSCGDVITAFCQILSGIGEQLPVDNRQFVAEVYTILTTMMEDETNGDCTYN